MQLNQRKEADRADGTKATENEDKVKGLSLIATSSTLKQDVFDQQSLVLLIFRELLTSSNHYPVTPRKVEPCLGKNGIKLNLQVESLQVTMDNT